MEFSEMNMSDEESSITGRSLSTIGSVRKSLLKPSVVKDMVYSIIPESPQTELFLIHHNVNLRPNLELSTCFNVKYQETHDPPNPTQLSTEEEWQQIHLWEQEAKLKLLKKRKPASGRNGPGASGI